MISLQDIRLAYNDKTIFSGISWLITDRSRIGLVGENGAGKTTLFRAIKGDAALDGGAIEVARNQRVGYLPQDLVELEPLPVMDYLKKQTGQEELERNIRSCHDNVVAGDHRHDGFSAILNRFDAASEAFLLRDGYGFEARARRILKGLGFAAGDDARNCRDFSGGWKMRIFLAVILLSDPDIMLLDEPTNHLDTESMEWLENFLRNYGGTLLAISHDRRFLDKMVNQVAELERGSITIYKGNYSYYLKEKEKKALALEKKRELQKAEIKRIQAYIDRFRAKASKASEVQSRIKQLEKFELLPDHEKVEAGPFSLPRGQAQRQGGPGGPGPGKRIQRPPGLFRDQLHGVPRREDRPAGRERRRQIHPGAHPGRQRKPEPGQRPMGLPGQGGFLFPGKPAERGLRQHGLAGNARGRRHGPRDLELRNLLGAFLFSGDDIHKPVSVLSGGEKSRLALVKILLQDSNCLILDEPTNHLDLKTKDMFQNALLHYSGTIVLVSHDRYFLDNLVSRVLEIRDGRLHEYIGNYSYFIQKREAEFAAAALDAAALRPEARSPRRAEAPRKTGRTKEERRQEAEERNRRGASKKELAGNSAGWRRRSSRLEELTSRDQALLCDPEVLKDSLRIKPLMKELKRARTARWRPAPALGKADAWPGRARGEIKYSVSDELAMNDLLVLL